MNREAPRWWPQAPARGLHLPTEETLARAGATSAGRASDHIDGVAVAVGATTSQASLYGRSARASSRRDAGVARPTARPETFQGAGGDARDGEAPQTTLGCQLDRRRPPRSTSGKDHRGRQAEVAPLRKSTFRHGVVSLSSWPPESNLAARPTTWRPTSMSLSDHSKAEEAAIASRAKIAITTDHSPKLGRHWGRLGKSRSSTVGPAPLFQEVREGLEQARSGGERLGELRSPSALRV